MFSGNLSDEDDEIVEEVRVIEGLQFQYQTLHYHKISNRSTCAFAFQIPVYLSKSLADNLFILQYPNKKSNINFEKARVVNSCVKPMNQELKLEIALDTASRHYDAFKGEQFAIAADGKVRT